MFLLIAAPLVGVQSYASEDVVPTADQVLLAVAQNQQNQDRSIQHYTSLRRYTLRNSRFGIDASMTVRVDYTQDAGKTFTVLTQSGSDRVRTRVFEPMFKAEVDASRGKARDEARLDPTNYDVKMIGRESMAGYDCFVLSILPKHKSKYLLKGKVWIDVHALEPVQMEGRPTASVSFWVGEPKIHEKFAKRSSVWVPIRMTARSSGFLLGSSELTVDYYEYQF